MECKIWKDAGNWPDFLETNPFDHFWNYLVIPCARLWFNPRNVENKVVIDLSLLFVYERTGKFYSLLNYNVDEMFRRIYLVWHFPLADASIISFEVD